MPTSPCRISFSMGAKYLETDDQWLAERLAAIVIGKPVARRREDSLTWDLGETNNWWLHKRPLGLFELQYRYPLAERMAALRVVILWLLGIAEINED